MVENPLSGPRRHRSRLSIIAEVLDLARRGALKTQIMYGASLSFVQLSEYLSFLLDVNLLKAVETAKKTIYKTTSKGLLYLQSYVKIEEMLKKEKGDNPRARVYPVA